MFLSPRVPQNLLGEVRVVCQVSDVSVVGVVSCWEVQFRRLLVFWMDCWSSLWWNRLVSDCHLWYVVLEKGFVPVYGFSFHTLSWAAICELWDSFPVCWRKDCSPHSECCWICVAFVWELTNVISGSISPDVWAVWKPGIDILDSLFDALC